MPRPRCRSGAQRRRLPGTVPPLPGRETSCSAVSARSARSLPLASSRAPLPRRRTPPVRNRHRHSAGCSRSFRPSPTRPSRSSPPWRRPCSSRAARTRTTPTSRAGSRTSGSSSTTTSRATSCPRRPAPVDPTTIPNRARPSSTSDSLYGGGPEASPELYDGAKLRLVPTARRERVPGLRRPAPARRQRHHRRRPQRREPHHPAAARRLRALPQPAVDQGLLVPRGTAPDAPALPVPRPQRLPAGGRRPRSHAPDRPDEPAADAGRVLGRGLPLRPLGGARRLRAQRADRTTTRSPSSASRSRRGPWPAGGRSPRASASTGRTSSTSKGPSTTSATSHGCSTRRSRNPSSSCRSRAPRRRARTCSPSAP